MNRLYIVDQSGLEQGGHYYAYTTCVAEGARQLGLEPVVLANKRLRPPPGTELPPEILPIFTHTWGEAEISGRLDWGEGNIAYELFEAFRRVPPTADDHVFLHTTGYRELRALLACLTEKLPGDLPYFHLLLRYDPEILIDNFGDYADYFARIAASRFLRDKIRLHTDTDLLSDAFSKICGLPFATAPIPFDQGWLRQALAARQPRRPGDRLTVAYLGDAREEKGYQHLPQALAALWKDYIAPGRVEFVLQSNFNTPGGEPGILTAAQNLAGFPATRLLPDPLPPAAYYQVLADADIVLIPYSARRYRYRSSGVLIEAMSAGKVVVTTTGSWMATQVGPDHAVLFETPAEFGPAIAAAIDRFEELSAGAARHAEAVRARATGDCLVRHLLDVARPAISQTISAERGRRVLLVMNGDAMVLNNGASRVAHAQLQYLTAAGYSIVGLFLTYNAPENREAFSRWRSELGRATAPFTFERVFVAGPGRWGGERDRSPELRDQQQHSGAPLKAEFDFVATFEFGAALLRFLRDHPVDAVLLNYITNFPVVEALRLDRVPVICEIHDIQSSQRAIYGRRLVDAADLEEELSWLGRCSALLSLNPREAEILRERLPDKLVATTGVLLPPKPPLLPSLAGAKDLAEIVSSSGPLRPEYQFETAWEIGRVDFIQRLIDAGTLDILYVSSAHMANVSGLKWFLSEVYLPFLAPHRVSMVVAGSIARIGGWPQSPRLFFIDQVADLAPLYAAARVVVLPITEGAGSPVKTFEALSYGRPVVGTEHAFRGIESEPGEFTIKTDPRDFADAVLELINSPEERREAAERSRRTAARLNDYGRYFATMDEVFGRLLGCGETLTPAPELVVAEADLEWSLPLQAANRLLRSYLDGEVLEGWAIDTLAGEDPEEVDRLLDGISSSLLSDRDAAVLRTERRLKRYLAAALGSRLREDAVCAVQLALAGRRGTSTLAASGPMRVLTCGALPIIVAGDAATADERTPPRLVINDAPIAMRPLADPRLGGRAGGILTAEIAAGRGLNAAGLRIIEIDTADGGPGNGLAVLRHSIPIAALARLLQRAVFAGAFSIRSDAAIAELPPGETGTLSIPRISDGQGVAFVDLCFGHAETEGARASHARRGPPRLRVVSDGAPIEGEWIPIGAMLRLNMDALPAFGDFGNIELSLTNEAIEEPLRLVAIHSGLLIGPVERANRVATILALAERRTFAADRARLPDLARTAIEAILAGTGIGDDALDAVAAAGVDPTSDHTMRSLTAQVLARSVRQREASSGAANTAADVIADLRALLASALGSGDPTVAVMSPLLSLEVVDRAGNVLPLPTEAMQRQRGARWQVPLPAPHTDHRLRIRLGAALEIPGHPGVVETSGFYPTETIAAEYRWTGPEPTATVVIPLVLSLPARLDIELGLTGRNDPADDLIIACNGRRMPHTVTADEPVTILTAYLPAQPLPRSTVEIALTVSECFRQPPDQRLLGVVFRSLSLTLGETAPEIPEFASAPIGMGEGDIEPAPLDSGFKDGAEDEVQEKPSALADDVAHSENSERVLIRRQNRRRRLRSETTIDAGAGEGE